MIHMTKYSNTIGVGRSWRPALTSIHCGAAILACVTSALTASAGTDNRAPEVPDQIAVDSQNNKVHFHGFGVGFQVYTWKGSSWSGAIPDATLFDEEGNIVATHFGVFDANGGFVGPAWRSNSGSETVGLLPPAAVIVDTNAIPWLRLKAVENLTHGPGIFAETTFIQRVNTTGGKTPSQPGAFVGQVARIPYSADYFFYRHISD
jgi:hypothetical protein